MRKPNIDKMSYAELLELRDRVQEGIEQRKAEEQIALRAKMEELAAEAGFDLDDLVAKRWWEAGQGRSEVPQSQGRNSDLDRAWPSAEMAGCRTQ